MKINGVTVTPPALMSVDINDIDGEAFRTATGRLVRDRIAVKRKIECEWNALTKTQMAAIIGAMSATSFPVEYLDPQTGTKQTRTFYVGERSAPVYRLIAGKELWEGLTANMIEI
jgi:hypothetical protein